LLLESAQLDALEHNTYIEYGFAKGPLVKVIDPESERSLVRTTFKACFSNADKDQRQDKGQKRKRDDNENVDGGFILEAVPKKKHVEPKKKCVEPRPKKNHIEPKKEHVETPVSTTMANHTSDPASPPSGGCVWSEVDWSCAYDSTVMSMFYTYMSFGIQA
jgi:hypothetical protein